MNNIPSWLIEDENYKPKKDSSSFLNGSEKALMTILSKFKRNNINKKAKESNISLRLFGVLVLLILVSVSRNFSFVLFMITLVVVRLAMMQGEGIKQWLKGIFPALIFSAIILLPSLFIGSPKTFLTILGKIFVSVSMVLILNINAGFNEITRALKSYHVPDIFIFTLDIAIKYIYILGEVCANMLTALRVRSIGKNTKKHSSAGGILSLVFIKSREYADITSKAMECRGFSGEYVVSKKKFKLTKYDFISIFVFVIIVGAFAYLEVIL